MSTFIDTGTCPDCRKRPNAVLDLYGCSVCLGWEDAPVTALEPFQEFVDPRTQPTPVRGRKVGRSAAVAALAGLLTAAGFTTLVAVRPVSAEVATSSFTAPFTPSQPAPEQAAARTPITPLPTPCRVQEQRLHETQTALANDMGSNALIEAEDAALIAQALIAQCGWSAEQVITGG